MFPGIGLMGGGVLLSGVFALTAFMQEAELQKCLSAAVCLNRSELELSMALKWVGLAVGPLEAHLALTF